MTDSLYDALDKEIKDALTEKSGALKPFTTKVAEEYHNLSAGTLIRDPYFLNAAKHLFPAHQKMIEEIYEAKKQYGIKLVVISGGIGMGKTFIASAMTWLEWFYFSTTPNPQEVWPFISPETKTAFILMSKTEVQAKRIVFDNVAKLFESEFNKEYFPPNKQTKRALIIPRNNTLIFPGTGQATSLLGYNTFSAVLDEINFLKSLTNTVSSNYSDDPAKVMYDQANDRIFSRWGHNGGLIFAISSARLPFPFSWQEAMIYKAMQEGMEKSKIFFRRLPLWKAKPKQFFDSTGYFLFNAETFEIITDKDMVDDYLQAKERSNLPSEYNPYLGGLSI